MNNYLVYKDITIRKATIEDTFILYYWWNDPKIMSHAGFPNGLNISLKEIENNLKTFYNDDFSLFIILINDIEVGELNYKKVDSYYEILKDYNIEIPTNFNNDLKTVSIGIKICDESFQNKGYGKKILSLFINYLFNKKGYERVILDTNLNNLCAQHVYERIGFKKVDISYNSWLNQIGEPQSTVFYELNKNDFISFINQD